MAQALVFFGVVLTVLVLIHYYLWRRLVRSTLPPGRARRLGTWATVGLALLLVVTFLGGWILPGGAWLAWPGYLWLAVMFYLLVILAALELPALIVRLVLRRTPASPTATEPTVSEPTASKPTVSNPMATDAPALDPPATTPAASSATVTTSSSAPDLSRRLLLARGVAVTAGVASVGLVTAGTFSAMGPPRLRRVQIPLRRLPRSADGLRIALLADLHLGPILGLAHTRRIVDMINGMAADVVAVVGDLVDGTVAELGPAAAPLRELRSRYGAFFVTGNHEYYSGHEEWVVEVARLGLRPLRNAHVELPHGLDLAGVNDVTGGAFGEPPDVGAALAGRDPTRPVVMLAHQPILAHDTAAHGVDLQLSGHTHGGQMVPFDLIVRLAQQPVVSGLAEVDGMPIFVTNGAGFWGPPVRVGAPPDVTLVELGTH